MEATYPGGLPRNELQISNFKRQVSTHVSDIPKSSGIREEANELYTVMMKAHLEDKDVKFCRDIKAYPDLAIVLAAERQLSDITRFCCNPFEYSVLTVDPTFSLGKFDVIPTTYRHLLLECKWSGKPPVLIGPTLIHYKKNFQTYLFFTSSVVGL